MEAAKPGPSQAKVTIKIPRALYNNLKEVIAGSGFNSVTDFVVYVLRDIVSAERTKAEGDRLSKDELEAVRQRLKALGYL
jgi:metal-responsive CopG/Arc/MetJ family transcriptional regulator